VRVFHEHGIYTQSTKVDNQQWHQLEISSYQFYQNSHKAWSQIFEFNLKKKKKRKFQSHSCCLLKSLERENQGGMRTNFLHSQSHKHKITTTSKINNTMQNQGCKTERL
jgi:hypothetical protein